MGANRSPVLGHIDCPVCALDMQVKLDKNGDASGYCPDCSQQLFTRNPHKSGLLLKRMRPVEPDQAPADAAPKPAEPVAVPVFLPKSAPEPAAKPAPGRQAGAQDANAIKDDKTHAPQEKTPQKAANPVAGGWWAPVLGNSARKGAQHGG